MSIKADGSTAFAHLMFVWLILLRWAHRVCPLLLLLLLPPWLPHRMADKLPSHLLPQKGRAQTTCLSNNRLTHPKSLHPEGIFF